MGESMAEVDVAWFARLKDRDLRREGIVVAEGRLVAERAAARCEALGILCVPAAFNDAKAISQERIPIRVMSEAEISALAGYAFHRGLLLAARRPEKKSIKTHLDELASARRLVVLPCVMDPENLGALVRTAAALGWDGVLVGPGSCDLYSRRVLRCSMGAVFALPVLSFGSVAELDVLRSLGWAFWAAMIRPEAQAPEALSSIAKLALVLGNERFGIEADALLLCNNTVSIPQMRSEADGVDSLNVAAAAAILLWEGRLHIEPTLKIS